MKWQAGDRVAFCNRPGGRQRNPGDRGTVIAVSDSEVTIEWSLGEPMSYWITDDQLLLLTLRRAH